MRKILKTSSNIVRVISGLFAIIMAYMTWQSITSLSSDKYDILSFVICATVLIFLIVLLIMASKTCSLDDLSSSENKKRKAILIVTMLLNLILIAFFVCCGFGLFNVGTFGQVNKGGVAVFFCIIAGGLLLFSNILYLIYFAHIKKEK